MTTVQRIDNLFINSGKSKSSILKEIDFSPTALAEWNKGKSKPTTEAIVKLAKYFNVSADYLLCLTDEPRLLENTEKGQMSLSAIEKGQVSWLMQEQRFADTAKLYNSLPDQSRERVFGLVMGIAIGL